MGFRFADAVPAQADTLRYEPRPQRIRALQDGRPVADTTDAYLVWEPRRVVPLYAVPWDDLTEPSLGEHVEPDLSALPPVLPPGRFASHTSPGDLVSLAGRDAVGFRPDDPDLGGRVILDWDAFTWLEEDQPVVGHPHDPFKRIDVLPSSRRVEVSVDGTVLASSARPMMLLETHLPVRWYFPRDDVRLDLLTPSSAHTTCAYKGHATYFSYRPAGDEGSDLAWTYADPLHDALQVRDHIAFFNERSDVTVDGVMHERPVTFWSRPT